MKNNSQLLMQKKIKNKKKLEKTALNRGIALSKYMLEIPQPNLFYLVHRDRIHQETPSYGHKNREPKVE